jgi:hypothetical protein
MDTGKIGVIGGSGLYAMAALENVREVEVTTPFGPPSDAYILGTLHGCDMVFLPRHGRGHRLPPSAINFRANMYGLKALGVEWVIAVSAVGSMREEIQPGHLVIPDQFIDRTRSRVSTFFEELTVHVALADPVCAVVTNALHQAAATTRATVHFGGTYLCMEGPQFSTRLSLSTGSGVLTSLHDEHARSKAGPRGGVVLRPWRWPQTRLLASALPTDIGEILAILRRSIRLAQGSHCTHSAAASGYSHRPQYGLRRRPSLRSAMTQS